MANIKIEGLEEVIERLRTNIDAQRELRKGFTAVGFHLMNEAKKRAPVDKGLLKNSIAFEVDHSPVPLFVKIGALPHYAPYMEYGTGLVHDHPNWPKKVHVVPVSAIMGWGHLGSMNPYAVARGIMRRGGLKPRRYLRGALEDETATVIRMVAGALKKAGNV